MIADRDAPFVQEIILDERTVKKNYHDLMKVYMEIINNRWQRCDLH